MKKALLLTAASSLVAFLLATLLNEVAPHVGTQVVEAQSCCAPPLQPWPGVKWPKNTEVQVKIDSAFDDVEVEAIKAAFKEWDVRGLNTCSNVTGRGYDETDGQSDSLEDCYTVAVVVSVTADGRA